MEKIAGLPAKFHSTRMTGFLQELGGTVKTSSNLLDSCFLFMQSLQNDTIHKFTLKLKLLTNVYSKEYTNTRNSNNDTMTIKQHNIDKIQQQW
jgi:hypothetical protein